MGQPSLGWLQITYYCDVLLSKQRLLLLTLLAVYHYLDVDCCAVVTYRCFADPRLSSSSFLRWSSSCSCDAVKFLYCYCCVVLAFICSRYVFLCCLRWKKILKKHAKKRKTKQKQGWPGWMVISWSGFCVGVVHVSASLILCFTVRTFTLGSGRAQWLVLSGTRFRTYMAVEIPGGWLWHFYTTVLGPRLDTRYSCIFFLKIMYHFGDLCGADSDCTGGAKYLGRGCMEHADNVETLGDHLS